VNPQMNEDTRRIPVDAEYANALGYSVYCFCYLEWGAVWIIQCLEPGYIHQIQGRTAGQFANHLVKVISKATTLEADVHLRLLAFSKRFKDLVERRNALVHGTPFTAKDGEQRLSYSGKTGKTDWTVDKITALAKEFEAASIEAAELFHNHLAHRR
jgi:hypothetical protein